MLLLVAIVVIALVVGRLAGGRLENIGSLDIKWWWLAPIAFAIQILPPIGGDSAPWVALALLMLSYALLVTLLVANIKRAGAWLMLVGILMNVVVIVANQGMPVSVDAVLASGQADELTNLIQNEDGIKHDILEDDDLFPFLADVIPVPPPFRQVVAAGDLVFYAGLAWFLVAAMRKRPEDREPEQAAAPPAPAG